MTRGHSLLMGSLSRATDVFFPMRPASVVIVAPHPDDEVFGAGLLIAAAVRRGVKLTIVVLTDGQASHPASQRWPPRALGRLRRHETRRALRRLGAGHAAVRFVGWPDGALVRERRSRRLRQTIAAACADVVVVASSRDFHPDHQAAARLAREAVRHTRTALFSYEVWSRVGGQVRVPRVRDRALANKSWATRAYRSQIGPYIADDPGGFVLDRTALAALTYSPERYARLSPVKSRPQ